ncbi:helix-turn-helix domain-containing protein [Paenibacillus mesotrionivorans]|uniref:Helix-turn-helix domain-containing protein n=1 Tax=Paenibacillus mesotrionivorans TaxID=3160968 RepID=A0ACC7NZJ0_9BACL
MKLELPVTLIGSSPLALPVKTVQGEYVLLYPNSQEMMLRYGEFEIRVKRDQAVLVPPPAKKVPLLHVENEGRMIRFRAAPFLGRALNEFRHPVVIPPASAIRRTLETFRTDMDEPQDLHGQFLYSSALYALITEILYVLHKDRSEQPEPEREAPTDIKGRPIIYAVRYMTAHLSDADLDLAAIAAAVNYHPNYFCEEFKIIMGVTPMRYLKLLRLKTAVQLLETTGCTIKEICRQVGINKPDALALHLRQSTGLTPVQYRQKHRRPPAYSDRKINVLQMIQAGT